MIYTNGATKNIYFLLYVLLAREKLHLWSGSSGNTAHALPCDITTSFIYLFIHVCLSVCVVVCGLLDTIHLQKQDMGLVGALCPVWNGPMRNMRDSCNVAFHDFTCSITLSWEVRVNHKNLKWLLIFFILTLSLANMLWYRFYDFL